jgi:transposase
MSALRRDGLVNVTAVVCARRHMPAANGDLRPRCAPLSAGGDCQCGRPSRAPRSARRKKLNLCHERPAICVAFRLAQSQFALRDDRLAAVALGRARLRPLAWTAAPPSRSRMWRSSPSARATQVGRRLLKVPGIGRMLFSAFVASVADPTISKSGRDLAA